MAAEWEVIAADPTTGILLFDQRLPADNKTQAIAQSGVGNFVQTNSAQIQARGVNMNNVQIIARLAPSGYASEVVPSLFGQAFTPGAQLTQQQRATLTQNSQLVTSANAHDYVQPVTSANPSPTQPISSSSSGVASSVSSSTASSGGLSGLLSGLGGSGGGVSTTELLIAAAAVASILALTRG